MPALKKVRHEIFAQLVAEGKTLKDAYLGAGYKSTIRPEASGHAISKIPAVAARITEIREMKERIIIESQQLAATKMAQKIGEQLLYSREWVIEQLIDNVQIAKSVKPVTDAEGNPIGEFRVDLSNANRALELLGKELGMFIERKMTVKSPLDELPLQEQQQLLEIIKTMNGSERAATAILLENAKPIDAERVDE